MFFTGKKKIEAIKEWSGVDVNFGLKNACFLLIFLANHRNNKSWK